MIVEERVYTIIPGKVGEYLANYERHGKPIHWKHLGEPVGWFRSPKPVT